MLFLLTSYSHKDVKLKWKNQIMIICADASWIRYSTLIVHTPDTFTAAWSLTHLSVSVREWVRLCVWHDYTFNNGKIGENNRQEMRSDRQWCQRCSTFCLSLWKVWKFFFFLWWNQWKQGMLTGVAVTNYNKKLPPGRKICSSPPEPK